MTAKADDEALFLFAMDKQLRDDLRAACKERRESGKYKPREATMKAFITEALEEKLYEYVWVEE